jgi:hypothetical protein
MFSLSFVSGDLVMGRFPIQGVLSNIQKIYTFGKYFEWEQDRESNL